MLYAKNNIDIQKPTKKAFSEINVLSKLIAVGGLDTAIYYNLKLAPESLKFETIMLGIENYSKLMKKPKKSIYKQFFEKLEKITGINHSQHYESSLKILPFDDITSILVQYL